MIMICLILTIDTRECGTVIIYQVGVMQNYNLQSRK